MSFLFWVFTYTHAVSQTLSIFLFVQVVNANHIIDQGEYDRQLSNVEGPPLMGGDVRWHGFHASKGILSEGGFRKIDEEGDLLMIVLLMWRRMIEWVQCDLVEWV